MGRHRGGNKYGRSDADDFIVQRNFYSQDDRQVHANPRRGGPQGGIQGKSKFKQSRQRSHTAGLPVNLIADDVAMDGAGQVGFGGGPRGRGSIRARLGRRGGRTMTYPGMDRLVNDNPHQWFKVEVFGAKSYDKTDLLRVFAGAVQVPFAPYHYEVLEKNDVVVFYVEGTSVIRELKKAKDRITMPDGRRLNWRYMVTIPPEPKLNDAVKQLITNEMGTRYIPDTRALDLSAFAQREAFRSQNLFVSLGRNNIVDTVIQIIKEHIPETTALDLSNNKFSSPRCLTAFKDALPGLKILYYKENGLRNLVSMKAIEDWNLEEINLEGNPVHQKEDDAGYDTYLRFLREMFPRLERLDGRVLPKPKSFDVDLGKVDMPPTLPGVSANAEGSHLSVTFLTQYFQCVSAGDWNSLSLAYHENASLSLSSMASKKRSVFLQKFRNLRTMDDAYNRNNRMARGREAVINLLRELPKATFDLSSFVVDVPIVQATLLLVEVTGFMKDPNNILLQFSRTFTLAPSGGGVAVINDVFFVSAPPPDWVRYMNKGPQEIQPPLVQAAPVVLAATAPTTVPAVPLPAQAAVPAAVDAIPLTEEQKALMVQRFSMESGLKPDWSIKCLAGNSWNYEQAAQDFLGHKARGAVPAEAYAVVTV